MILLCDTKNDFNDIKAAIIGSNGMVIGFWKVMIQLTSATAHLKKQRKCAWLPPTATP